MTADVPFRILREDLRRKVRQRLRNSLIVFLVDASDSMGEGTDRRMAAAKGAVLALLTTAYQQRDRIAVVAFRDRQAEVLLRPTNSVSHAREQLQKLPTGGATPLADGLRRAWDLIRIERVRDPHIRPLLVLISDGEANVPLAPRAPVAEELEALCARISADHVRTLAIDTKPIGAGPSEMKHLAETLGATYHHILNLKAGTVVGAIRRFMDTADEKNPK